MIQVDNNKRMRMTLHEWENTGDHGEKHRGNSLEIACEVKAQPVSASGWKGHPRRTAIHRHVLDPMNGIYGDSSTQEGAQGGNTVWATLWARSKYIEPSQSLSEYTMVPTLSEDKSMLLLNMYYNPSTPPPPPLGSFPLMRSKGEYMVVDVDTGNVVLESSLSVKPLIVSKSMNQKDSCNLAPIVEFSEQHPYTLRVTTQMFMPEQMVGSNLRLDTPHAQEIRESRTDINPVRVTKENIQPVNGEAIAAQSRGKFGMQQRYCPVSHSIRFVEEFDLFPMWNLRKKREWLRFMREELLGVARIVKYANKTRHPDPVMVKSLSDTTINLVLEFVFGGPRDTAPWVE